MYNELKQFLPVEIIDKGRGFAIAVIDYGQEHHLCWVVVLDGSGEIWCTPNPRVRMQPNWSMQATRRSGANPVNMPAADYTLSTQALNKTPSGPYNQQQQQNNWQGLNICPHGIAVGNTCVQCDILRQVC